MSARQTREVLRPLAGVALAWSIVTVGGWATPAEAYDPITWYTVDGGGCVGAVGGAYQLSGSIGQPDAGTHAGGGFVLRGGFWRRVTAPAPSLHTYVWSTTSGLWSSPSSWTPPRNTPAPDDTLIFDGAVTPTATVTDIPLDTFGKLHIRNSAAVTIKNDSGGDTLRIAGTAGDDFIIEAGSRLWLSATPGSGNSVKIALASGATGRISGELWVAYGPHRVLPTDAGSLVFASGANCRAMDGLIGSFFGNAGAEGVVVFQSGSCYHQDGGDVAFGLLAPQSRIVLEHGSLYRHLSPGAGGAFDGRTYGDCEISMIPGSAYIGHLVMGCTVDDLSITSGRLSVFASASNSTLDIRGRLVVIGDGTLEVGGPGPAIAWIRFTGSAMQSAYFGGTIQFAPLSLLEVVNPAGLMLETYLFTSGSVLLSGGHFYTSSHLLHLGPASYVTGPHWVIGNLGRIVPTSGSYLTRTFEVGDFAHAAPVAIEFESVADSGTVVVHTDGGDHSDLAASGLDPERSVNRTWTVTNLGTDFPSCSAIFEFDPAEIDSGANPNLFGVGQRESGAWSLPSIGTRTATSTQAMFLTSFGEFVVAEPEGSVGVEDDDIPAVTSFSAVRPSPFRTSAALEFALARRGKIELSIFDVSGRRVRVLDHGVREAGVHRALWDGRNDERAAVPAGAYFARLVTDHGSFRRRLIRVP